MVKNNMIRVLSAFLLLVAPYFVCAQNLKDNQRKAQAIQNDSQRYLWGFGDGANVNEATQNAKQDLLTSISAKVESNQTSTMRNVQNGQDVQTEMEDMNVIKIKAAGQLKGTHVLVLANPPQCRVMAYMEKAQLDSIYQARRQRVVQHCIDAQNAEKLGRIDDALRFYYWGLCLLKSVEDAGNVKYNDHLLITWIPQQMRDIFRNIKTEVAEIDGQNIKLFTTYNDKPVASLDFRYHDGLRISDLSHAAKDGMSYVTTIKSYDENKLHIFYEYEYRNEMRNDPELEYLMNMYGDGSFREANATVDFGDKKKMKEVKAQFEEVAQEQATPTNAFMKRTQAKDFTKTVMGIAEAIKSKKYDAVKGDFTPEGYEMFDQLIHYGNAEILTVPELHCFPYRDKIICRSIPMRFTYKNNKRAFIEDVTFTFNADDKIECVAFGLDKPTREQIYTDQHLEYWGDSTCTLLATFLENYQTAFALHRLDYIKSIFDDEAVIITGHLLKKASGTKAASEGKSITIKTTNNQKASYTKMDKEQYMERLEACFKRNEFINIHFSDCILDKMYDARFGINLRQDYFSSTYSDTGFLFLLVNVSDPELPLIQYRTWQPDRDVEVFNTKAAADDPRRGLVTAGLIQ